jgi:hypothetical protein
LRWHVEDGLQSANKRKEHVIIIEPDDEALHSGHFRKVRDSTPYPLSPAAVSRQVSMVPEDVASKAVLLRTRNDAQSMSMIQEQLPELNIGQGPAQPPKCDDVALYRVLGRCSRLFKPHRGSTTRLIGPILTSRGNPGKHFL